MGFKHMIELTDVSKCYTEKNKILNHVSLSVEQGDFLSIIGKSGSGKSSLLNIMGFLDKDFTGQYLFQGQSTNQLKAKTLEQLRLNHIGYIFQHYHLIHEYTICENIEMPLAYRNIPKKIRRKKVDDILERLDLRDKADKRPYQLSGGEQQRVAIARAILPNPSLILADEPTGSVDAKTAQIILELLNDLNRKGTTICLVTHDMDVANSANKSIEIVDGKINSR